MPQSRPARATNTKCDAETQTETVACGSQTESGSEHTAPAASMESEQMYTILKTLVNVLCTILQRLDGPSQDKTSQGNLQQLHDIVNLIKNQSASKGSGTEPAPSTSWTTQFAHFITKR
jgi:hypothetical protein